MYSLRHSIRDDDDNDDDDDDNNDGGKDKGMQRRAEVGMGETGRSMKEPDPIC